MSSIEKWAIRAVSAMVGVSLAVLLFFVWYVVMYIFNAADAPPQPPVIINIHPNRPPPPKLEFTPKVPAPKVPSDMVQVNMTAGELSAWFRAWEQCDGEYCID